jgi:hypothetical protein
MKKEFKKCVWCKASFVYERPNQKVCSIACAKADAEQTAKHKEKVKKQDWQRRRTQMRNDLMTLSDWLAKAQKEFNHYIRVRDRGKPCISCSKPINGVKHASHYLSSGNYPMVRFNEDNVWVSCYKCNDKLSGNLLEYRKNLIKKIGAERVEWLEGNGSKNKDWTIDELKDIIYTYKQKIKSNR